MSTPTVGATRFARRLRDAGVEVGTGQVVTYCRALDRLDPTDLTDLYWAGRACLVTRAADLAVYDRVFAAAHGAIAPAPPAHRPAATAHLDAVHDVPAGGRPPRADEQVTVGARAAAAEVLRAKRFGELSPGELAALRSLLNRLPLVAPRRRTRRHRPAPTGPRPDVRRALRGALRHQGELVEQRWRRRRVRPRRVVLLLDVSGSMTEYSRVLLLFGHALARQGGGVEVCCFGTRVTRVTDALARRDPDTALAAATQEVTDWDGGTRIAESLWTFLRRWGLSGMARGAVVVICSDGLERGDPGALAQAMQRLALVAHRVVWVNPLAGDARYRPLARGMAAALPHVDVFLPGHNLASLENLAQVLAKIR